MVRSRINERFARANRYPVTLIVAPAGFGKTVALRDYLASSGADAASYDVRPEHATLTSFARGLATAAAPLVPDAPAAFALLQQRLLGEEDQLGVLTDWFVEHFKDVFGTVVIDDLHYAMEDQRTVPFLVSLIERTSGRLKWILSSRNDAGLPIASWLAYGRIDVPVREEDLRFSRDEAVSVTSGEGVDDREIEALRSLTGGWPVALTLALHSRTHASDLAGIATGTRDLLYRYLAEQIFNGLDERSQSILLQTSVAGAFGLSLTEALGIRRVEVDQLRSAVGFLTETAPGAYRYHDLFREFLEAQLHAAGATQWRNVCETVAGALRAQGEDVAALRLYTRAACAGGIIEILQRNGTALFERGEGEALSEALASLNGSQRLDASVLGVKAMLEAARGHFELAERDFLDAIDRAQDGKLRLTLVHRYAIELIRHERNAITLLEPYVRDATLPPNLRVPMLATFATALARANRLDEAALNITAGINAIDGSVNDDARARFYQQAAFVHHLMSSRGHAWNYANLAIELAVKDGLYEVAARAYSVLYTIVYDDEDDPLESLILLDRLIECARKGGSVQTRLYGLMASFEIQAERGDDFAIERLEHEMERTAGTLMQTRAETLLPARAMRSASEGDFQHAFALLDGTGESQSNPERRALRESEIALYAYATGQTADAEAAHARSSAALAQCQNVTRRTTRTRVMLALCELIRGHSSAAHRFLSEAERAGSIRSRRLRSLVTAARALYRRTLDQVDAEDVEAALERLRTDQFGGIARMLEALPLAPEGQHGGYALLTPSERRILSALARGGTSKDIGTASGRSAQTVDTHIRSICRKLKCSGRREAVALAIRSGWVET